MKTLKTLKTLEKLKNKRILSMADENTQWRKYKDVFIVFKKHQWIKPPVNYLFTVFYTRFQMLSPLSFLMKIYLKG
jgi:hypothetical protein